MKPLDLVLCTTFAALGPGCLFTSVDDDEAGGSVSSADGTADASSSSSAGDGTSVGSSADETSLGSSDDSSSGSGDSTETGADGLPSAIAIDLAVGRLHSCALTDAGAVRCWGYSDQGQLGNGAPLDDVAFATPVEVV